MITSDGQTPSRSAEASVLVSVAPTSKCEPLLELGGSRQRFDTQARRAHVHEGDAPGTQLAQLTVHRCDARLVRDVLCDVHRVGGAREQQQQVRLQRAADSDPHVWRLELGRPFDREAEAAPPLFEVRCVHPGSFSQSNHQHGVGLLDFSYARNLCRALVVSFD